jgi:hypothetical protein
MPLQRLWRRRHTVHPMSFTADKRALLELACQSMGHERFVKSVEDLLDRIAREAGSPNRSHFLKEHSNDVRGHYQRAIRGGTVVNFRQLELLFSSLGLPFEARGAAPLPWARLAPGAPVAIIVGVRLAKIEKVAKNVMQRVVGERDVQAVCALQAGLARLCGGSLRTELVLLPASLSRPDARRRLEELRGKFSSGAIIAVGSPITNPIADLVAEAILEGRPCPVQFHWRCALRDSCLSHPEAVSPSEEGIAVRDDARRFSGKRFFQRAGDDLIRKARSAERTEPFPDAGVLMIACTPGQPVLVLAAGHGGCGTKASVRMLTEHATRISSRLHQATFLVKPDGQPRGDEIPPLHIGANKLCEVIEVRRHAEGTLYPPAGAVDDLDIHRYDFARYVGFDD